MSAAIAAPPPSAPKPAAPAAPAAPPPKPAAPAKPSGAPSPGQPPPAPSEQPIDTWLKEAGDELDALDQGKPTKPQTRQKPPAKPPERGVEPPDEPTETPEPGEPAEPTETPEAAAPPAAEPKTINELRTAYKAQKKKVAEELEPTITKLQARVKELEGANPPEVKTLQEKLVAAEKRRDELEEKIAYVDFQSSKKYLEEYHKPYVEAWNDALTDLEELTVELPNGETRQATQGDLERLANMPLGEARKEANARFGDSADDVMRHRAKIIDLAKKQAKAIEDNKKAAVENARLSQVQTKEEAEKTKEAWTAANEQIVKRWPNMFGPKEDDPEGNAQLTKGQALAARLFNQTEENKPKSREEAIALHAMLYQKIANHDRLALWLKKARTELAQVKEELEQYRASEPTGGLSRGPRGGGSGDYMKEAEAELEDLDRKSGV